MTFYNLQSFGGLFVLIGIAWLLSADRRQFNLRVVAWGLGLQFLFASFVFLLPVGSHIFLYVNDAVVKVMESAAAGAGFLFGRLAVPPGGSSASGETSLGFVLAFQAFPTIIFFSALVAILYYYRIMPKIIGLFANMFTRSMRLSGAESLSAASNIFVGVESALTIKPYLSAMTRSELCTVLTAGMATVSSNVLALYVFTVQEQFPTIAGHLVSASFLSAPAALMMSKLLLPEDGRPATLGRSVAPHYEREGNLFEAIINGANSGVRLIVGIAALLLAVLGLVALMDMLLSQAGTQINDGTGWTLDLSLRSLLSYLFYPFTLLLGIPLDEVWLAAGIIGERVVATEVVSYQHLAEAIEAGTISTRSAVIVAYALCGFAHLASMAIFVGGVAALAPDQKRKLAEVGLRALAAATLACLLTACMAGIFFSNDSILLGG